MSRHRRSLSLVITALIVVSLVVFDSGAKSFQSILFGPGLVIAQNTRPRDVWQQVYQQLPDLPLENKYVNKETGKVDPENTLVSRLVRYHVYVKGRPPNYRLDWKLTLADYLGENELMGETVYPGYDTLRSNPIEGDRAVINRLNRKQRDALVQTLVNVFNSERVAPETPSPSPDARPIVP